MNKIVSEAWDLIKKNLGIVLVGTFFLILYFNGCGNRNGQGKNTSDTTTHTVQVPQPIVIMPQYQPQQSGGTIYVPIPQSSQGVIPASTVAELTAQVKDLSTRIEALGREYYATHNYSDSFQLKDTVGRRVGVVKLDQTVSENILKSTQPTYQLSFPHTYTTITNTIYPPVRNQVFFGASVQSPINSPKLGVVDMGILLKNKKENVISLSATYDLQTKQPGVRVGYYQKISLKSLTPKLPLPTISSTTQ